MIKMIQGDPINAFRRLASKGYTALMNDGYDLLVRTTVNAAGMKSAGEDIGNVVNLIGETSEALDRVLYDTALVKF